MFGAIDAVEIHPRRRWTAVVSFTLQAAAVGAALVVPVFHPARLPIAFAHPPIFVPVSLPTEHNVRTGQSNQTRNGISIGNVVPIIVAHDNGVHYGPLRPWAPSDDAPPLPPGPASWEGVSGPNVGEIPLPSVRPTLEQHPPISVMMQGNLVHRVEPDYPAIARTAGVQGSVLIKAIISADGKIERAQAISGSPLLIPAALRAIQQWRYRPYFLNHQPIEVETEITVNFILQR